ncbi:nicotinate (nicotinamide) nucleotide adenylyltransferase [Eubacterium sp.]|uniref:nicotinate (nicotinamide) nucleotide adenylyltransferase n=1 Tax=Eubacterium sp. TaxID=142586 RepID=UPI003F113267
MNIGIFGGAFNPVHNGHLALAGHYRESLSLDRLIYIPTANPPHKPSDNLIDGEHRINMLKLCVGNDKVCDIEFRHDGKSYTYLTLQELRQAYPDDKLYLIIGADQFFYFENWYKYDEILSLATVVTAAREHNQYSQMLEFKAKHPSLKDVVVSEFEVIDVSSSQIRDAVKNGEDISQYVPKRVEEYIKEHRLYV